MSNADDLSPEVIAALRESDRAARARRETLKRELGVHDTPPAKVSTFAPLRVVRGAARSRDELEAIERDRRARQLERARMIAPPAFRWSSFDAPELAKRVANARAIELARGLGLEDRAVFRGASGVGKTSLAAAALRALSLKHQRASMRFVSAFALSTARARHPLGQGEPDLIAAALRCDLLVVDELGSDEESASSAIREVIFDRHWNARATWVTTWMSTTDLAKKYGDGIARRIVEGATILDCGGRAP